MAMADYRLCDVCGGKAFYDVNLNYEGGEKQSDGSWKYPDHPFRVAGEAQAFGLSLDRMGDWAVLCNECAKTHKAVIVPLGTPDQPTDDSTLEPGEEWCMNVAGVMVRRDEWEPGAVKRRATDNGSAASQPTAYCRYCGVPDGDGHTAACVALVGRR